MIPHSDTLPVGHPARPLVRTALSASVLNAVLFTVFAYVTTQMKTVRHGSPWQDDPYDTVVTFTMFFVPIVTALIVLRVPLCRRNEPLPLHRAAQLLRAAVVSAVLVTATCATDWTAVFARADHALWDSRTPWLIAALALMSASAAASWVGLARARGLLPRAADDHMPGDWADDALPLLALVAARLPQSAGRFTAWLDHRDVTGWIRRRTTGIVGTASLVAGLTVAVALAREDGFGPLFFSEAVWFAGGMYAFGMIANAVLHLTVHPPRSRPREALHTAVVAGAAALPVSLGLRDSLLAAAGLNGVHSTTGSITALTLVSAALTCTVVFAVMMARPHRS